MVTGWQVVAGCCCLALGKIGCKVVYSAAPKISLQLLWLLAGHHSHPYFVWKIATCLQTLANYTLREVKLVKVQWKPDRKAVSLQSKSSW